MGNRNRGLCGFILGLTSTGTIFIAACIAYLLYHLSFCKDNQHKIDNGVCDDKQAVNLSIFIWCLNFLSIIFATISGFSASHLFCDRNSRVRNDEIDYTAVQTANQLELQTERNSESPQIIDQPQITSTYLEPSSNFQSLSLECYNPDLQPEYIQKPQNQIIYSSIQPNTTRVSLPQAFMDNQRDLDAINEMHINNTSPIQNRCNQDCRLSQNTLNDTQYNFRYLSCLTDNHSSFPITNTNINAPSSSQNPRSALHSASLSTNANNRQQPIQRFSTKNHEIISPTQSSSPTIIYMLSDTPSPKLRTIKRRPEANLQSKQTQHLS